MAWPRPRVFRPTISGSGENPPNCLTISSFLLPCFALSLYFFFFISIGCFMVMGWSWSFDIPNEIPPDFGYKCTISLSVKGLLFGKEVRGSLKPILRLCGKIWSLFSILDQFLTFTFVIKSLLTCPECFFWLIAIDDGLVSCRDTPNRKFRGSILHTSFMKFARNSDKPFASQIYIGNSDLGFRHRILKVRNLWKHSFKKTICTCKLNNKASPIKGSRAECF